MPNDPIQDGNGSIGALSGQRVSSHTGVFTSTKYMQDGSIEGEINYRSVNDMRN